MQMWLGEAGGEIRWIFVIPTILVPTNIRRLRGTNTITPQAVELERLAMCAVVQIIDLEVSSCMWDNIAEGRLAVEMIAPAVALCVQLVPDVHVLIRKVAVVREEQRALAITRSMLLTR
jgi:hypothetical protein